MTTRKTRRMMERATARAIDLAGGPSAVARALGVTHGAVIQWRTRNRVPPHHVHPLCELCDGEIQVWQLRPDVFPR